ncbi:MAG: MmgE/PrpD family protein [Alphaproteobacteria bacterium]
MSITEQAATFASGLTYDALPEDALHVARRCMIDGIGQFIAGASSPPVRHVADDVIDQGGRPDALVIGRSDVRVPAPLAARVLGTAGHAHDWDDTQATRDPRHVYGLLTHPTIAPLAAALAMGQRRGTGSGKAFMTAFQAGFEVECKIAEWMLPEVYKRGFHASAAEATFAAAVTAGKLLALDVECMRTAIGIAASNAAAGIRANVGTMTKPLHFGKAAENGVMAALLAARGMEAGRDALDGDFGFLSVFAGGVFEEKLGEGFGSTLSIVDPGVAVKPYPSGILSHQAMDAMLALVQEHDIQPDQVEAATFHAGSNILKPLAYRHADDHMQAKFCMPALLAMCILRRRAGHHEFEDDFIRSAPMQALQRRISVSLDPEIEAKGFDKIRSRIELLTIDGHRLEIRADERYRGSPDNPMTDEEIERKFLICTEGALSAGQQRSLLDAIWTIDGETENAASLARMMTTPPASE